MGFLFNETQGGVSKGQRRGSASEGRRRRKRELNVQWRQRLLDHIKEAACQG